MTGRTGFFGAGKPTWLHRILHGGCGLCVAVDMNEFGSISIGAKPVGGFGVRGHRQSTVGALTGGGRTTDARPALP
jgi:G3E family GTPase